MFYIPEVLLQREHLKPRIATDLLPASLSHCAFLQGVTFPAMMSLWARWSPPLERSRLMTLSGSGASFGAFVALPLTGYICQTLGWPAVFYICGEEGKPKYNHIPQSASPPHYLLFFNFSPYLQ